MFLKRASSGDKIAECNFGLTFRLGKYGQNVKTASISDSPGTVSFQYMPTSDGTITITAQVVDSVLYQATDTATFIAKANTVSPLSFDNAKVNGLNTKFSWSGGTGPYGVYKAAGDGLLCSGTDNCSVSRTLAPAGTDVYVKDSTSKKDSTTVSN